MNLSDDPSCPICQEDMYSFEKLMYCSKSCGHNFHANCIKIWSEHKKDKDKDFDYLNLNKSNISCPMCRGIIDEELLKSITLNTNTNGSNYNPKQGKSHKNVNCKTCTRTNIKGERIHCLECENFDLCRECVGKHEHRIICKRFPEDNWIGCEVVNSDIITKKFKIFIFPNRCFT